MNAGRADFTIALIDGSIIDQRQVSKISPNPSF